MFSWKNNGMVCLNNQYWNVLKVDLDQMRRILGKKSNRRHLSLPVSSSLCCATKASKIEACVLHPSFFVCVCVCVCECVCVWKRERERESRARAYFNSSNGSKRHNEVFSGGKGKKSSFLDVQLNKISRSKQNLCLLKIWFLS